MAKDWVIGIDLGGTQIRAVRAGRSGEIDVRAARPTEAEQGGEAVLERIFECVDEVLEGARLEQVTGIGIGAPGPIDPEGRLHDPPNLPGWKTFSLSERLSDRFGVPAFAGNDANLAALGENRFGAGQGIEHLIYMTVSTGIGGGVVSGGKPLLGAQGFAAEIGHQTLVEGGPICGCGQPGHLEALAAGPAIARRAGEELAGGATSALAYLPGELTAEHVTDAAKEGDALAIELLREAATYIGLGLVNLIHVVNPERILIGGGVSQAGDLLFEPIRETVHDRVMSPVYRSVEILPAALGEIVGLLGAVALVLQEG